jgi:hypothetical protein
MTTKIDTTMLEQNHFTPTQLVAAPQPAETYQATAYDPAGSGLLQFLVGPASIGPVFIRDTEESVPVRKP